MHDRKRKVLIADDEPNIVTALDFLLRRAGYDVRAAGDGGTALALVESYMPDIVLLDLTMPIKSGYQVCQRIRERADCRHVKVVILSARGREAEVTKGMSVGADAYVRKPFSTQALLDTIDALFAEGVKPNTA